MNASSFPAARRRGRRELPPSSGHPAPIEVAQWSPILGTRARRCLFQCQRQTAEFSRQTFKHRLIRVVTRIDDPHEHVTGGIAGKHGQRQGTAPPLEQTAALACTRLDARVEQALLEVVAISTRTCDEQVLERDPCGPRLDQTAQNGCVPRLPVESEASPALVDAVTFLVELANRSPVVTARRSPVRRCWAARTRPR